MIVYVPLEDSPFHKDPEWPNWQGFIQWFRENSDWAYFINLLLSDPLFRVRFYNFMAAAERYEQQLKNRWKTLPSQGLRRGELSLTLLI